jgi:hypothetical protein
LRVNAPEQRADVEIEQQAVIIDDPAGLRPGRQGKQRPLFERLHDLHPRRKSGCEVGFGQIARGAKVPEQIRHLSVIAGWHFFDPVNMQALSG